jgi:serine/threonine protein kinase/Tol biopolymer transport system component
MAITTGTSFGPYEVLALLGAGGMGEVYRARDARLERDVAVKVLPPHLAEDAVALARFEREARAIAALSHPNILGIFDVGREGSTAYVVTELLEGETLRERLAAGALPPRKAADYAAQMARGLAAAHEKGIVHRDLKPENVSVTSDGRVKILDFGLAKQEQPPADLGPTNTPTRMATTDPGVVLGTVAYMAPEQVRGQPLDHRADLFACGVTLYEMLTGRRAFQRETAAETMTAILREEPPELAALDPKIPPGLARIVQHCLEKRPEERFQSARDLAFDLEAIAAGSTTGAQPTAMPEPRRRRWVTVATVAVAAAVCVTGAYLAGRFTEHRAITPLPTFHQLTFQPQKITGAAFAPDGETVVFSAARESSAPGLFILRPEYPEPTPLGLEHTHLLAVSSKGELAVLTNVEGSPWRGFTGKLARVPLGGTGPRPLLDRVCSADWSPDGTELAVIVSGSRDRVEYPIGKVLYESSGALGWVRVSPRGDRIALTEHPSHFDDRGFVITVDRSGKRTVLAGEYGSLEGLAWSPDGRELLFTGGSSYGSYEARAVDLGGHLRVAARSAGGLTLLDVSRTGRWLVTRDDRAIGIMGHGPSGQTEIELSFLDGSWGPLLSNDGRTMVFTDVTAQVGANYTFYMRGTDGSPVVRLGEGVVTDISPDGKWTLAITQVPQQVVICPIGSGEKRTLDRGSLVGVRSATFFPDGTRILVCGNEEGKASRCYVQDVAGGTPRAVTPDGERGLVSPDGRRVVVWTVGDTPSLCQLEGDGCGAIPSVSKTDGPIGWSLDGQSLLVLRTSSGERLGAIERVDLRSGKREVVREITMPERLGELFLASASLSADMKAYAYAFFRMRSVLFLVDGAR